VVLSDRTIERLIADGRITIDPYDEALLQPSSLDVRVDRYFRVFHNARYPYIDVKQPQEELTEQVEITDDQPFILHPGEFVLGSTLERVGLPDDLVARLEGKALALDTEVPTPSGWKTMAEVAVGDIVFTERGEPTVVVRVTEPMLGRPCREVRFSEGTTVVCDEAHQWVTEDDRVLTTAEIEASGRETCLTPSRCQTPVVTLSAIVDIRRVASVPVKCIEVSAPSGQFLITHSYIPTHNSSLGRLGLLIHSTAGFIDPGWDGHVTLSCRTSPTCRSRSTTA
jgi:deoxycytidine triphosphate deaminase